MEATPFTTHSKKLLPVHGDSIHYSQYMSLLTVNVHFPWVVTWRLHSLFTLHILWVVATPLSTQWRELWMGLGIECVVNGRVNGSLDCHSQKSIHSIAVHNSIHKSLHSQLTVYRTLFANEPYKRDYILLRWRLIYSHLLWVVDEAIHNSQ